jgi:hypothetical protein
MINLWHNLFLGMPTSAMYQAINCASSLVLMDISCLVCDFTMRLAIYCFASANDTPPRAVQTGDTGDDPISQSAASLQLFLSPGKARAAGGGSPRWMGVVAALVRHQRPRNQSWRRRRIVIGQVLAGVLDPAATRRSLPLITSWLWHAAIPSRCGT